MSRAPVILLGALILFVSCRAKEDEFFARAFPCEPGDSCGTSRSGAPMICYNATQLGAHDFCAETCDPSTEPEEKDGYACLSSGARFPTCAPTNPSEKDRCPPGLNCLRTDLIGNLGICMDVHVCSGDADCSGQDSRKTCASTVLGGMAPAGLPLSLNNLYCLQKGCRTSGTLCLPGESCLSTVVTTSSTPDICVPNCTDSHCPPNFACAQKVYGKQWAAVCIPGIPGYRCERSSDCIVGGCVDTGAGFNQCTIPCASDYLCGALNTPSDVFTCVRDVVGPGSHCVLLTDFNGTICHEDADCEQAGQLCFHVDPYRNATSGRCRYPCGTDGQCPRPGGVPLVCVANGQGGCYPGRFGLPCASDDQCTVNFKCLGDPVDAGSASAVAVKTCTIPCASDADCDANVWTTQDGFCEAGLCRLGGGVGAPCDSDRVCRSIRCEFADGGTTGVCSDGTTTP